MILYEFDSHGYKLKVHDSLLDNNIIADWSKMADSSHHLRPEMLLILEKSRPRDLQFRYLFIYNESTSNEVCGIIYLQLLNFNHRNFNFTNKNLLHYFALGILKLRSFKVLLAGSLFAVDFSPVSIDTRLIEPDVLVKLMENYSEIEKYDILVLKDLPVQYSKSLLEKYSYKPFETDMTMQLEINPAWESFKDYEKALTHKYGQRVRKIRKQGSAIERREITEKDFSKYRSRIKELFNQVSEKQTIRMGIVDDVYFEELFKGLGKNFMITGYFHTENLVGFASHILYTDKLEVHYIGIDYKINQPYCLYFNILYDGIELAIRHQKKSLELGRTAREAKAVVGCHPIYFNDYIKIHNPLIRWMLDLLSNYFNKGIGEGWKKRHPFKTIATGIVSK